MSNPSYQKFIAAFLRDISEVCARHADIIENATVAKDDHETAAAASNDKPEKKKTKKEKKDPNAPKNPPSAYLLFANEQRPLLVKEQPDIKMKDVMIELGLRWRNLPEVKKMKYQEQSLTNRKEYETQIKEYKEQLAHDNSASPAKGLATPQDATSESEVKTPTKGRKSGTTTSSPKGSPSASPKEANSGDSSGDEAIPEPKVAKKGKRGTPTKKAAANDAAADGGDSKNSKKKKAEPVVAEEGPKKRKKRKASD